MQRSTTDKLAELKKKVQKQAKKDMDKLLDVSVKKEAKMPTYTVPKKGKDVKVLESIEEKNRVEFFKRLDRSFDSMDNEELIASITDFGEKGDDKRKVFTKVLLEFIPYKKLKKYMKDVIDGANSDNLLKAMKFKTQDMTSGEASMADAINNVIQNEESALAHERFANVIASRKGKDRITAFDLYVEDMNKTGIIDQRTIVESWRNTDENTKNTYKNRALATNKKRDEDEKKTKKHILSIDDEAEPIPRIVIDVREAMTRPVIDSQALYDYMRHLWIPNYASTYISTPKDMQDDIDPKFIIDSGKDDDKVVYDERTWYRPSKYFYLMQIGRFADDRKQDGINLICYDGSLDNPVVFNVIHKTKDNNVILQNEKIFKDENNWFKKKNISQDMKLNEFINTPIDSMSPSVLDTITMFMRKYLAITLTTELSNANRTDKAKLKPVDIPDPIFTENDSFITDLESAFMTRANGKTLDYYLEEISSFLVFVERSFTGGSYVIFKSRVRANMYSPSKIPSLTIEEKVPEIFNDPTIPDNKGDSKAVRAKDVIKSSIQYVINCRKKTLACILFNHIYPRDMITNIPICQDSIPTIAEPAELSTKNRCRIEKMHPHEIIYYKEGDNTYCFSIYEIIGMISSNNFVNPFTNNKFSDEFVDSILSFNENFIVDPTVGRKETAAVMGTTKGYPTIDDLMTKIADMEQAYFDKLEKTETSPSDEIVEETVEIPMEVQEQTSEEESSSVNPDFIEDVTVTPIQGENVGLTCEVCKKPITDNTYTTIADASVSTPTIVNFCSTKCFSEWNEGK